MTLVPARPTLFLIAGPNGAGKSTFHDTVLAPRVKVPFINADVIQRDELRDPSLDAAYRASRIATERRATRIAAGLSFATETVFSHPSKLALMDEAHRAGFRLIVFHLNLASAELAVLRVRERMREGGHAVPEAKIRARYRRNQPLIRQAVPAADRGLVFDSSALNAPPVLLMDVGHGVVDRVAPHRPAWFERLYGDLVA